MGTARRILGKSAEVSLNAHDENSGKLVRYYAENYGLAPPEDYRAAPSQVVEMAGDLDEAVRRCSGAWEVRR